MKLTPDTVRVAAEQGKSGKILCGGYVILRSRSGEYVVKEVQVKMPVGHFYDDCGPGTRCLMNALKEKAIKLYGSHRDPQVQEAWVY